MSMRRTSRSGLRLLLGVALVAGSAGAQVLAGMNDPNAWTLSWFAIAVFSSGIGGYLTLPQPGPIKKLLAGYNR